MTGLEKCIQLRALNAEQTLWYPSALAEIGLYIVVIVLARIEIVEANIDTIK